MELGVQLTWLLPVLILISLCCKCILFAFCKLSLKLFLTLLTEAESKGLCLKGLTPLCPFLTSMSPLSWSGHLAHPLSSPVLCCSCLGLAGHSTGALDKGARCPKGSAKLLNIIPCLRQGRLAARQQDCCMLPAMDCDYCL